MTEELLVELPQPVIQMAEKFTVEAAFTGFLCLEGEEFIDWLTLKARKRVAWELN